MNDSIRSRASWNAPVIVPDKGKAELMFWKMNARIVNASGKSLTTFKTFYEACIFADASSSG